MTDHPYEAAILLLSSMHKQRHPDRRRCSFMFNQPGLPLFCSGSGTEVNFHSAKLLECALYLQKHGARHLQTLSVDTVESDLMNFVIETYYLLAGETFLRSFAGPYAENLSKERIGAFAGALAASRFFVAPQLTAMFPLVPITVDEAFGSAPFFLCRLADYTSNSATSRRRSTLFRGPFRHSATGTGGGKSRLPG
jgi:hypothetical protein